MEPAVPPASLFDWRLPVERTTVRVTPPAKQTRRGILRFRKDYELAILKARRIHASNLAKLFSEMRLSGIVIHTRIVLEEWIDT